MRLLHTLKALRSPEIVLPAAAVLMAATELLQRQIGGGWVFAAGRMAILLACGGLLLGHDSGRDGLTGAENYSRYARRLKKGFEEERICVLFADADDLKKTNDRWGHEAGDRLLRRLAESFRAVMSRHDVLFRVGGDEFVLVLTKTAPEDLTDFLARWQDELLRRNKEEEIPLAVSCGWAWGSGKEFAQLTRRADDAMYRNKARKDAGNAPD